MTVQRCQRQGWTLSSAWIHRDININYEACMQIDALLFFVLWESETLTFPRSNTTLSTGHPDSERRTGQHMLKASAGIKQTKATDATTAPMTLPAAYHRTPTERGTQTATAIAPVILDLYWTTYLHILRDRTQDPLRLCMPHVTEKHVPTAAINLPVAAFVLAPELSYRPLPLWPQLLA